jgi:hydrogenase nickel incorporation protein HypA/HybF
VHESGVVRDLVARIEEVARAQQAGKIRTIRVWLGALSHMTESHFLDHFRIESRGSLAEGAEVEVELSDDVGDPNAQGVLLRSLDVEELG